MGEELYRGRNPQKVVLIAGRERRAAAAPPGAGRGGEGSRGQGSPGQPRAAEPARGRPAGGGERRGAGVEKGHKGTAGKKEKQLREGEAQVKGPEGEEKVSV